MMPQEDDPEVDESSPSWLGYKRILEAKKRSYLQGHTRWANELLKGRCHQITDLRKSISDGTTLANIVELLTREKFPSIPAGKLSSPSEKADILQQCVDRLQAQGVDLQGVTANELASGNLKSTLMLMTNIRKKYDKDFTEQDLMGERAPMSSPHPSRSAPSTLGQASSSQHPHGVTQSGARPAIGSRRPPPHDDIIPGTIRHSSTSHLVSAPEQNLYGTSQYGGDHQFYHNDNRYMAAPVPPTRTSKPGGSQNETHPPPTSATQAWLTTSSGVKSHATAQNRGTDVGRSPALDRRVNLRSRDRSPAPGGRAGVVNGAFNYEEGELLSPPIPLPPRARSVQGGAPSPGVRGGYGREGEDTGDHSYVPSRPTDSATYGSRPPSAQSRTQQPIVPETVNKPPQIPPKYFPPPQYSPYCGVEGTGETTNPTAAPANDMRSACSKLYTTSNFTQMNGTSSPHPMPKYPSGIYSNVHARQTPSGSSGSPQSYSSQLSPTLKRHDVDRLRRYSQQSSPQEEEWKPMTPSMSRSQLSSNQYTRPTGDMTPVTQRRVSGDMTPTMQRRVSSDMTPTSHRRGSCVTFSDGKGMHTNSLTKGQSRENSPNCRLADGQTRHIPARISTGENRYVNFSNGQDVHYNSLERRHGNCSSSPALANRSIGKAQGSKQEVTDMPRTVGNLAGAERSRTGVSFNMNTNTGVPKSGGQLSSEQQYNCQQMSPGSRRPPVSSSYKVGAGKQLSPRSQLPLGSDYGNPTTDTKKLYNSLATDDDDNFSVSSMSDTPPLPPLSPDNTPPTTPPLSPRHKLAAHLPTPDVIHSATKDSTKRHSAKKSGGQVSLKTWDGRGKRVNPGKAARGTRSRSAGSRVVRSYGVLEDLPESDDFGGSTTNLSNTEDGLEETTLTSREMRTMRRQMEGLEAMYQEMLKAVGLDREYGAGSRHSISSASSMARSTRRFGRQQQQHRHQRELKHVNKRFARLESHVVTLARSVAHLTSEVHSQNALRQDIEALKVDIQDVRKDVKVVGGKTPLNEWERFRGWVPSLTNPKRVKKLTKFFGQEPPLIHIFLRKLNYEKYIPKFDAEKITMVELPYMTEEMLQKIGIPLGPSRRILQEAQMCFRQENFNIYIV